MPAKKLTSRRRDRGVIPAAAHPMQPLVLDREGVVRFKENTIVRFLLERGGFDLNDLAAMSFDNDDRAQFAQLVGYSVSGYCELSYVDRLAMQAADAAEAAFFKEQKALGGGR